MTSASLDLPRLGRYQVLSKLAQGGMAEIFLAKALGVMGFERLVAIKLIHASLTKDPEFVKMFIDEARIAMHLHHRNIVQVFDLDKADDTYFIAMEYVHGVNLYDLYEAIAAQGRWLDPALALYIVAETCKGLHFAHTRTSPDGKPLGIVHRDISPQNVLLSFEGEVKITDFGIAKAQERLHHTTPGIVKGKYAYMAPEILKDEPATSSVDVFAAGVLLYECLVGENPFAGNTPIETIEAVIEKEVPPPSSRGAPCPAELDHIALKALAKDPKDRWPSAQALADALTDHALNMTQTRKEMASGDSRVSQVLTHLFPEKARGIATPDPEGVQLPMAESAAEITVDTPAAKLPDDAISTPVGARARPAIQGKASYDVEERPTERALPALSRDDEPTLEPAVVEDDDQDMTLLDRDFRALPALQEDQRPTQEQSRFDASPPVAKSAPASPSSSGLAPVAMDPAEALRSSPALSPVPPQTPSFSTTDAVDAVKREQRTKMLGLAGFGLAIVLTVAAVAIKLGSSGPELTTVRLITRPPGATVTISGQPQSSKTPLEATLPVDRTHDIVIELDGYERLERRFRPVQGVESPELSFDLIPIRGTLTIKTKPETAKIIVNGNPRGQGTVVISELPLNTEVIVRVEAEGYRSSELGITLSSSDPQRIKEIELTKLEDKKKKRRGR